MKMKKDKWLKNMEYNRLSVMSKLALREFESLFVELGKDDIPQKKDIQALITKIELFREKWYPDAWRPENPLQASHPWDSEV